MKKKLLILLVFLIFPVMVNATDQNSQVYFGNNQGTCTSSSFQDKTINTDGDVYFSHCMEAVCSNRKYTIYYYNDNKVKCTNGNSSPYSEIKKSACNSLNTRVCNNNEKTYCSMIVYYDCGRLSNGDSFTTTTTTKKTTRVTNYTNTTNTTTQKIESNTYLSSISLSSGNINFSKEVYEYDIEVESTVKSINVTAVPEDNSSTIKIEGNNDIINGSVIKITVTGTDGKESIYTIKVTKKEEEKKLSNNARLKSLKIRNHEFGFNSKINDYSIIIESNEYELDIYEVVAEDENATVKVNNNSNLTNDSVVSIVVTAEDGKTINTYNLNIRVKKKSNLIKYLFIIILILAIIAGIYYLYKKIVASKSGDKYEYE